MFFHIAKFSFVAKCYNVTIKHVEQSAQPEYEQTLRGVQTRCRRTKSKVVYEAITSSRTLEAPKSGKNWIASFLSWFVSSCKNPLQSFVNPLNLFPGEKGIPHVCTVGSTDPSFLTKYLHSAMI